MFHNLVQPVTYWRVMLRVSFKSRRPIGQGIQNGEVSLYHWPPVWLVWNQQNRLIQTSQTGGQWYSDTSSFGILCIGFKTQTSKGFLHPKRFSDFSLKTYETVKRAKCLGTTSQMDGHFRVAKTFLRSVIYFTVCKIKVLWERMLILIYHIFYTAKALHNNVVQLLTPRCSFNLSKLDKRAII